MVVSFKMRENCIGDVHWTTDGQKQEEMKIELNAYSSRRRHKAALPRSPLASHIEGASRSNSEITPGRLPPAFFLFLLHWNSPFLVILSRLNLT